MRLAHQLVYTALLIRQSLQIFVGVRDQKFTLIEGAKEGYSIKSLCDTFDVHRSSCRYQIKSSKKIRLENLRTDIEVKQRMS